MPFLKDLGVICRMIKIEHSVFALPFAYVGAFLAARGWPGLWNMLVLTAAMVAVRSFAMAFNRYADLDIDRENPRTQGRPLVTGELSTGFTLLFILGTAAVFVACCALMNQLCLLLSPLALGLSAFYSFCKRFTYWCHFVLGMVLGLAPLAGWLCVDPSFSLPAVLYFCGVTLWVAGFDLLYACQDADFDRERGLWSMPSRLGVPSGPGLFHPEPRDRGDPVPAGGLERRAGRDLFPGGRSRGRDPHGRAPAGQAGRHEPGQRGLLHHERRHRSDPFPGRGR